MEEGKEGEWWGDSENSGTQGVLTGTPSHGGSGERALCPTDDDDAA